MTAMVISVQNSPDRKPISDQRVQVMVNVQAEVLDAEVARRKANVWLLENVGNLLGAEKPELILGERLLWRYDVILGYPNLEQPGIGEIYRVGQIVLDAITGEVQDANKLIEELQRNAATVGR